MTLSEKETKIILIKYIIHGVSPYSDAPFSTRVKMLKAAVEKDGKKWLSCAQAFEIASECGVKPAEVGSVCNHQGIKVHTCQLGLFK